ncbi:MAG: hypothetical protein RR860_16585, partial [Janthinobacterium sp.]
LLQCLMKGGLPPTVKAGLALRDFAVGTPRAPLQPLGEAATRELAAVLASLPAGAGAQFGALPRRRMLLERCMLRLMRGSP